MNFEWQESNTKGVGETVVSPWRKAAERSGALENRGFPRCEIAKRPVRSTFDNNTYIAYNVIRNLESLNSYLLHRGGGVRKIDYSALGVVGCVLLGILLMCIGLFVPESAFGMMFSDEVAVQARIAAACAGSVLFFVGIILGMMPR